MHIEKIREVDESPGLQDFEISFLRLIEKLSDGCKIQINETGTSIKLAPGMICGGSIIHDCGTAKGIGWFIEGILPLLFLGREMSFITFYGMTNDAYDLSVDTLQHATIPLLRKIGINGLKLKVSRRGAFPNGGGIVEFTCPIYKEIASIRLIDNGLIKRVRGIAFSSRMSPTVLSRVIESARRILNEFLPDVYIGSDLHAGSTGGLSAGYSLSLFAESTSGFIISAERTSAPGELPENVGAEAAYLLLDEVHRGGAIDSSHQVLILQLMIMASEDVSKVRFGTTLTDQAIEILRTFREVFGVLFKIKKDTQNGNTFLSCAGLALQNISRKVS